MISIDFNHINKTRKVFHATTLNLFVVKVFIYNI